VIIDETFKKNRSFLASMYDLNQTTLGYNLQKYFEAKALEEKVHREMGQLNEGLNLVSHPTQLSHFALESRRLNDVVEKVLSETERITEHDGFEDSVAKDRTEYPISWVLGDYIRAIEKHIHLRYPLVHFPTERELGDAIAPTEFALGYGLIGTEGNYPLAVRDAERLLRKTGIDQQPHKIMMKHAGRLEREVRIENRKGIKGFALEPSTRIGKAKRFVEFHPATLSKPFPTRFTPPVVALAGFPSVDEALTATLSYQSDDLVKKMTKRLKSDGLNLKEWYV